MSPEQWWELGACRGVDPRIFDGHHDYIGSGHGHGKNNQQDYTEAAAICAKCTVKPQCLDYMLNMPPAVSQEDHPYAAGMTPLQLMRLRRKKGRLR